MNEVKGCLKDNLKGLHSEVCKETKCSELTHPFFIEALQFNFERFVSKEKKWNPLEIDYEIELRLPSDEILGWYDDGFYICKVRDGSGRGWHDFRTKNAKPPVTWFQIFWEEVKLIVKDFCYDYTRTKN
jgi:hypothetical protein